MSLRINTNVPAMTALRNLGNTSQDIATSINRLSTGLKIVTAGDDPAGLIISEGMRAQLSGISRAIENSQDAVNMSKTAEGALDEVQTLLKNIRGIAVQAANSMARPELRPTAPTLRTSVARVSEAPLVAFKFQTARSR